MAINHEAYRIAKQYTGKVEEIPGRNHNDMIIEFHATTELAANTDEVPWCSSFVNWAITIANIKRNPVRSFLMLKVNGLTPLQIVVLFGRAGFYLKGATVAMKMADLEDSVLKTLQNTGEPIVPPTFSAAAISWAKWGVSVKGQQLIAGDIMVFTRKGGNHVAFWEDTGLLNYSVLGGNQSDAINVKPYLKTRLLDVRRGTV